MVFSNSTERTNYKFSLSIEGIPAPSEAGVGDLNGGSDCFFTIHVQLSQGRHSLGKGNMGRAGRSSQRRVQQCGATFILLAMRTPQSTHSRHSRTPNKAKLPASSWPPPGQCSVQHRRGPRRASCAPARRPGEPYARRGRSGHGSGHNLSRLGPCT